MRKLRSLRMEDFCWKCGSPSHHRPDCDSNEPENPEARKEIRKAFQKGTGAEKRLGQNALQWAKMLEKKDWAKSTSLPPVPIFKKELERVDQVFYELFQKMEDFPKLIGSISADCLEEREKFLIDFRNQIQSESSNVRLLDSLLKAYDCPPTWCSESSIMYGQVQKNQESQKTLSDWISSALPSLKAAKKVLHEVTEAEQDVQKFIQDGMDAFSGRPLQISRVQREWKEKKIQMKSMISLIEKYKYLYPDPDFNELKTKCETLSTAWGLLKTMKTDYERETAKATCKVCLEVDVGVAIIPCGHVFCLQCANNMNECPNCRGEITDFLRIFF